MSEIVKKIYQDYQDILDNTLDYRRSRDKCRKLYFGQQLSNKSSTEYKSRGWVDIVVNKIRPLLRSRVSMLVASKPQGKVFGVSKRDMSTAQALEEFLDFHWYNSDGALVAEDVSMYSQREGIGYYIVYVDPNAAYGLGEIKITSESYENVFVKKTSKKWDFEDAGRVIHSRLVNIDDFINRYRTYREEDLQPLLHPYDIPYWTGKEKHGEEKEIGYPIQTLGEADKTLREFDVYDRFYKDVQIIHNLPTGTIEVVPDDYTPTNEDNKLIKDGLIRIAVAPVPRINWIKALANGTSDGLRINEKELPIEYFPIIPVHDERTGNALSMGEVDFFQGLQELLNQSTSIMIHHAAMASMFKMIYDSNELKNPEILREQWSSPGAAIGLPFNPITGKPPIEIVRPEPINNAFWTMIQHWEGEMEYESQNNRMNWGDPTQAPETFSATMSLREWSQNALRLPLNHTEIAIQRVYETILQWSRSFYGFRQFNVIRNDSPVQNFINSPIPYPTGNFNKDTGEEITSRHDIRSLRAQYRIRMGSTTPSQTTAYMAMYQQLAQTNPAFFKQFINYLDIPADEKQELIQSIDVIPQLQAENKQLQQTIKQMQSIIKNLNQKDIDFRKEDMLNEYEMKMVKFQADAQIKFAKIENQLKVLAAKESAKITKKDK